MQFAEEVLDELLRILLGLLLSKDTGGKGGGGDRTMRRGTSSAGAGAQHRDTAGHGSSSWGRSCNTGTKGRVQMTLRALQETWIPQHMSRYQTGRLRNRQPKYPEAACG